MSQHTTPRTMLQLVTASLAVQDACNLSGVIISFATVISDLKRLLPNASTDEINQHHVCQLWSDKIAHLTGTQAIGHDAVTNAYDWCYAVVRESRKEQG